MAVSCGVGRRHGSDLTLLWLWRRPVAIASIGSLAWEPPYVVGMALEKDKRKKKKKGHESLHKCSYLPMDVSLYCTHGCVCNIPYESNSTLLYVYIILYSKAEVREILRYKKSIFFILQFVMLNAFVWWGLSVSTFFRVPVVTQQ